jgi:two-component SAPR family response regulator
MQVRLGGKAIAIKDWKTQVVRDLFFYLLLHPEGVTKEEIGEVFWPDADRDTRGCDLRTQSTACAGYWQRYCYLHR